MSTRGLCIRIKAECRKQGRPLRSVMKEAGLSLSTFYMWKAGNSPKPGSLAGVAEALKVSIKDLTEGLEEPAPPPRPTARATCEDIAFFGIRRSALEILRPFLLRVEPGFIELPSDISRSLFLLLRAGQRTAKE